MLEPVFRLLADYEPTISSLVGLLTLCAAIWGVLRLRVASRGRAAMEQQSPVPPAQVADRPGWQALFNLGLTEHSQLEELVSIRTVNVVLFCLLVISLPWLLVCLLVVQSLPLAILNLALFSAVLLGFALQRAGATTAARWMVILVATMYWMSMILTVGAMQGVEYFLAGLLTLPVLILSRAQRGQRLLSVAIILGVFILGVALTRGKAATGVLDETTLAFGYHVNALFLAGLIFASLSYYKQFAATSYQMLSSKKRANDALVSRLIPSELAQGMVNEDTPGAQWHPEGTVLVAALTGFSPLYTRLPAIELVAKLDSLYSRFDELIEGNGLDKVKTLGTVYVAAAGIRSTEGGYAPVAASALAMRAIVERFARKEDLPIGFRCGVATGLTISGVIGRSRPRFDIWGEALDAATRLEASGADGEILTNETAYWRLSKHFAMVSHESQTGCYRVIAELDADELAS